MLQKWVTSTLVVYAAFNRGSSVQRGHYTQLCSAVQKGTQSTTFSLGQVSVSLESKDMAGNDGRCLVCEAYHHEIMADALCARLITMDSSRHSRPWSLPSWLAMLSVLCSPQAVVRGPGQSVRHAGQPAWQTPRCAMQPPHHPSYVPCLPAPTAHVQIETQSVFS